MSIGTQPTVDVGDMVNPGGCVGDSAPRCTDALEGLSKRAARADWVVMVEDAAVAESWAAGVMGTSRASEAGDEAEFVPKARAEVGTKDEAAHERVDGRGGHWARCQGDAVDMWWPIWCGAPPKARNGLVLLAS